MTRLALIFALLQSGATPMLADYNLNGKTIDCYCTDSTGGRVELGEQICLHVDGRMFMAQCQMSLNVPMWREVSQGCLSSSLGPQHGNPLPYSAPVDAKI